MMTANKARACITTGPSVYFEAMCGVLFNVEGASSQLVQEIEGAG